MKNELLNEWGVYKPIKPSYILKGDEALKTNVNAKTFTSYDDFIKTHNPANTQTIHLGLLPVPYAGNLAKAKIFILLLNPGFKPINYFTEYNHKPYRQALLNNLKQKNLDPQYPFLFLNPRFLWTGGGRYWCQKFGNLIQEIMDKKEWDFQRTISHISRRIAIIQYFPYHSKVYSMKKKDVEKLESTRLAVSYVKEVLKPRAKTGNILILVTRKAKAWNIKGKNVINFEGPAARGAHLGKYRKEIMKHLDLD